MADREVLEGGGSDASASRGEGGGVDRWHVAVGFATDTGLVRERNEDCFAVHLPYAGEASRAPADALFAVADGMGGHQAGDYASQYVAGAAQRAFADREGHVADIPAWLERLIRRVNRELASIARRQSFPRGMGSTLTIAVVQSGKVYLGHVGDSRCYRLYGGDLEQLTPDHSWVGEQVRAGRLTPQQAEAHPNRNLLTECLGVDRDVRPYLAEEPLQDGARYLLCSDGLFGGVPAAVLRRVLVDEREPQTAAQRLISIANEAGGEDNITAVVFDVTRTSELASTLPGLERPAALTATGRSHAPAPPTEPAEAGDPPVAEAAPDSGSTAPNVGGAKPDAGSTAPDLTRALAAQTAVRARRFPRRAPRLSHVLFATGGLLLITGAGLTARNLVLDPTRESSAETRDVPPAITDPAPVTEGTSSDSAADANQEENDE